MSEMFVIRLPRAIAAILGFCLFGCGEAPKEAADKTVLSVLMEPDGLGVWREVFAEFMRQNPDIRVEQIEGPTANDAREDFSIQSLLSRSTDYDLILADVIWVPKFAAAGWLEDLTDYWPQSEWDDFVDSTIKGGSYQGRIFRVPVQLNGGLLYYRKDLLEQIGADPPETFEELVQTAIAAMREGEETGFLWQGKQYEGLVCDFLEVLVGFGGYWVDVATGKVGLDEPQAVNALEFLCDTIGTISPKGVTTYAEEESRLLFQSGRAVYLRNWPYVLRLMQTQDPEFSAKVGICSMPALPGEKHASTLGGSGFVIVRTSPKKEAAWRLIEFVSSPWAIEFMNDRMGLQPARKSFYESTDDPVQRQLYSVLKHTVSRPAIPQYAQVSDILQRNLSAALTQQTSAGEAMRRAARETRRLLGAAKP